MKKDYDIFNDMKIDTDEYENIKLTEEEKNAMMNRVRKSINKKTSYNKKVLVASLVFIMVGGVAITNDNVLAGIKNIIGKSTNGEIIIENQFDMADKMNISKDEVLISEEIAIEMASEVLSNLGIIGGNLVNVDIIKDNVEDKQNYVIKYDNATIELDYYTGDLRSISVDSLKGNVYDTSKWQLNNGILNKEEIKEIAQNQYELLGLPVEYKLNYIGEFSEDYFDVVWEKEVKSGIYSPFESVKMFLEKKDGRLINVNVLSYPLTTESNAPVLPKEKAENIAKTFGKDKGWSYDNNIILEVVKPNYMWYEEDKYYNSANFTRIAWTTTFNNGDITVNIDAEDGNILGGDMMKNIK